MAIALTKSDLDVNLLKNDDASLECKYDDVIEVLENAKHFINVLSDDDESLNGITKDLDVVINKVEQDHVASNCPEHYPPAATIRYAPEIIPVKGNFNLYCIALQWNDNPGASLSKVAASGRKTAEVYKKLSNGNVNFNVIPESVKVNFAATGKNLPSAERDAKKVVVARQKKPNTNPNLFVIVHNGAKSFSNGSGNTAHLFGTLARDFMHEVGHLRPFVLEHAGRYLDNGKLKGSGDGTSFMSTANSHSLTAPQLYLLGWLPNKVAQHNLTDPAIEYPIENLDTPGIDGNFKSVLIPREEGRSPLYLSLPNIQGQYLFALHTTSGRGSQRVKVFGNKPDSSVIYDGIEFSILPGVDGDSIVKIDSNSRPSPSR